jgi:hypothetical protein
VKGEKETADLSTTPVEMTILFEVEFSVSTKGPQNCRSLGFARDDKGKGKGSVESGCRTEAFFRSLDGPLSTQGEKKCSRHIDHFR